MLIRVLCYLGTDPLFDQGSEWCRILLRSLGIHGNAMGAISKIKHCRDGGMTEQVLAVV